MDPLAALRLQMEWGADEALDEAPRDRRTTQAPARAAPQPAPATPAASPAAATLAALRDLVAQSEGAGLRRTATNVVFAEGPPEARLVLIADVAGPDEDRSGRPFAGAGGAYLDQMLAAIGVSRAEAVLTCLVPWRPPGDRPPSEAELRASLPFLHQQLALIRPALAVLFGRTALRALAGGDVRRTRGKWLELAVPGRETTLPALALPTVAHIRATAAARRDAWADLIVLRRALDTLDQKNNADFTIEANLS